MDADVDADADADADKWNSNAHSSNELCCIRCHISEEGL